jgi:hypothetical protein
MPGDYMIYRQTAFALAAVLAGIIIPPKDFTPGQLDVWARPMNLAFEPDDRRTRDQLPHGSNVSASIHHHAGFACQ